MSRYVVLLVKIIKLFQMIHMPDEYVCPPNLQTKQERSYLAGSTTETHITSSQAKPNLLHYSYLQVSTSHQNSEN